MSLIPNLNRIPDMKIKALTSILTGVIFAVSCGYESEPPLTESARSTYVLPKGEVPTASESAEAEAARAEYENYIQ